MTLINSDSSPPPTNHSPLFSAYLTFIPSCRLGLMRADYHSLPDKAIDALELHYDRWVGDDDDSLTFCPQVVYHST
jgi:hypothetical protein